MGVDRSRDRLARRAEGAEQRVALRIHHPATMRFDRSTQRFGVLRQDIAVEIAAEPLEQIGRPLDVGEQEGDCAARQPSIKRHEPVVSLVTWLSKSGVHAHRAARQA